MGYGRYDAKDWASYKKTTKIDETNNVQEAFKSRSLSDNLSPLNINPFRESRDSSDNPLSTPIIIRVGYVT